MHVRWSLVSSFRAIIDGQDVEVPTLAALSAGPDPATFFLG